MIRKTLPTLLLLVVLTFFILNIKNDQSMKHTPLDEVKTYKVFYDEPTQKIQPLMQDYDLVIVEPAYYTKELVTALQRSGTKLYAYVSIMESDTWNTERTDSLQPEDFFARNGNRVYFEEWDSYLMDLTSSHYRSILLNDIQTRVVDKGFDGVFFDTVGDIEDQFYEKDDAEYNAQKEGFITFLDELTIHHKNLSKIQNWGIELFISDTAPYMDAIMWEDFDYTQIESDMWSQQQIKRLQDIQKERNIKVLTLSFDEHKKSSRYAKKKGFLHYGEQKNFNVWE